MFQYEKVLPIGTVVLLKGARKRIMILGYQRTAADNPETVFDYCGCTYPEGYISPEQTAIFNHEDIEKIYYIGLQNDEQTVFAEKLRTVISSR